ncbi:MULTISPECIES: hypothetical protein [Peptoniphilus]|uniref:hypothetical protein n=1 Tax=Peptoniphilus TaxID=162289 RepID=UPI0002D98F6C|nr:MULTISPECIES: hypothetical protein [Peptoniphilus]
MKLDKLPWASIDSPIYTNREIKPRKDWVIAGGWIMTAILIISGFTTKYKISLVFGVLYALALLMIKYVAVTNRGLEIFYDMKIMKHYELWEWKDIFALTHEKNIDYPEIIAIYFSKGDRSKRLFFDKRDKNAIIQMAKSLNPEIKIYDAEDEKRKHAAAKSKKK